MTHIKIILFILFLISFIKGQESITFSGSIAGTRLVGSTVTVRWSHSYTTTTNVNLDLYTSNTKIKNILENIPSSNITSPNQRDITVPAAVDGSDYRVRIVSATNSSVFAISDTFTISNNIATTITVNNFGNVAVGTSVAVSWTITGTARPTRVDLYGGNVFIQNIIERTSATSFTWQIPEHLVQGTTYQLRVMFIDEPDVVGSRSFSVSDTTSKSVTSVSSPTAGQRYYTGEALTVSFATSGMTATDRVRIELFNNTNYVTTIGSDVSATGGSYSWIIPQDLPDSRVYRVSVIHETLTHLRAQSNMFLVYAPLSGTTEGVINVTTSEVSVGSSKAYRLNAGNGRCYELTFDGFLTNAADILRIYDGDNDLANSLGSFSGSGIEQGRKVQTTQQYLYARYNALVSSTGFINVRYQSVPCNVPSFTFSSPSPVAQYTVGDTIPITWIYKGPIFYSQLLFRKGTEVLAFITDNAVSPVNYVIPSNLVYGTDYNILVSSIDPSFPSYSTSFTVFPARSLSFVNPSTADVVYTSGQNIEVRWLSTGIFNVVNLVLRKGAATIQTWTANTFTGVGGTQNVTIPANSLLGNDYTFVVSNGSTTATSVAFSVVAACDQDRTVTSLGGSGTVTLTSSQYIYNLNCRSTITSTSKNCLRVTFTQFSLGTGDVITVYEGDQTSNTIIRQLPWNATGTTTPIESSGYSVTVRISTTSSGGFGNGYSFNYVSFACPSTLDVLTPSAKSLWAKQQPVGTYVIQWNATNLGSQVKIDLADVGSLPNTTIATLASSVNTSIGFFNQFSLPATLTDYRDYVVRISSVNVPSFYQENSFTALPTTASRIVVSTPNHLTTAKRRSNIIITWTSNQVLASENVKIDLYAGTEYKQTLANNVNSTLGTNTFTTLDTFLTSERYRVYVIATSQSGIAGESPLFKVEQNEVAALTITNPTLNELILTGTTYTIRWTKTGLADNVNILLYAGGVFVNTIVNNLNASNGAHNYTFATENNGPFTLYVVRSEGLDVLATQTFYIVGSLVESITVLEPSGGDVYSIEGSNQLIQWTWRGFVERVNVDLLFKSTVVQNLATNVTNTGRLTFALSNFVFPYGVDYRVRVQGTLNNTNQGISLPFTITAVSSERISVTRPTTTLMTWTLGATETIQWTYPNGQPSVSTFLDIELHVGQKKRLVIAQEVKVTQTQFSWTIPTDLETFKPYRIIIFASRSRSVLGESPRFALQPNVVSNVVTGSNSILLGNFYSASWTGNTPHNYDVTLLDGTNNNKLWTIARKVTTTSYQFYPPLSLSNDNQTSYKVKVTEIANTAFTGTRTVSEVAGCSNVQIQQTAGSLQLTSSTQNMRCSYVFTNPNNNLCYYFQLTSLSGFSAINDAFEFYDGTNQNAKKLSEIQSSGLTTTPVVKTSGPRAYVTFKSSTSTPTFTLSYRSVECASPYVTVEPIRDIDESRFSIRWTTGYFNAYSALVNVFDQNNNLVITTGDIFNVGHAHLCCIDINDRGTYYATVTLKSDSTGAREFIGISKFFTLLGDLSVTLPSRVINQMYTTGSSMTVTYTNSFPNNQFSIFLFGITGTTYTNLATILTATNGGGSVVYTIPDTLPVHEQYAVRMVPANPANYKLPFFQTSGFQIRRKTQLVSSIQTPSNVALWAAGETHNIRWTTVGEFSEVTIDLFYQNGTYLERVAQNIPNTGVYSWTVPSRYTDTVNNHVLRIYPARLIIPSAIRQDAIFKFFSKCSNEFTGTTGSNTYNPATSQSSECLFVVKPTGTKCLNLNLNINIGPNDIVRVYNGDSVSSPLLDTVNGTFAATKLYSSYGPLSYWVKVDNTPNPTQVIMSYTTTCEEKLVVHNPSRFGSWKVGTTQTIQYNHILPTTTQFNVTLLSTTSGDTPLAVVSTSLAGSQTDGRITWNIPSNLPASSEYFLRFIQIPSTSTPDIVLTDSHKFSLSTADPKFVVNQPASFSTWLIGSTQTITWTTNGVAVSNVNIDLYSGGRSLIVTRIASEISNTGSFAYTIPTYIQPGFDYHIAVTDASDVRNIGVSNSLILNENNEGTITFTTQPPVTTTTGTQFTISFTKTNDIPFTDVLLYSGGKAVSILQSRFLLTSLNVTLATPATDYQIVITNGVNVNVSTSSNVFTVTEGVDVAPPAIFVGTPTFGDHLVSQENQQSYTIKWVWSGSIPNVKIELFHSTNSTSGSILTSIVSTTENLGYFTWTVPNNMIESNRYVIKVSDAANANVFGLSGEFTIQTSVSNSLRFYSSDPISLGQTRIIRWEPDSSSKYVDIYLAFERYVESLIARGVPNNGFYIWTVPKLKILPNIEYIVVPHGSETPVGVSSVNSIGSLPALTISVSLATFTTSVAIGNSYTISWTIPTSLTHTVSRVNVDLHEFNGDLVYAIACNVTTSATSGSLTWVPEKTGSLTAVDLSKNYHIRVYSADSVAIQGRGFSFKIREDIKLTTNCGNITQTSNEYTNNLDRTWAIDLSKTENTLGCIRFYFNSMDVRAGDSLTIYDSKEFDSSQSQSFAQSTAPVPFQIYGNYAVVRFLTDGATTGNGFEIQYAHVQCSTRIVVNTPSTGNIGESHTVSWTCTGNRDRNVTISLRSNSAGNIYDVGTNVPCSAQSFTHTLRNDISEGSQYSYQIVTTDSYNIIAFSSNFVINTRIRLLHTGPLTLIKGQSVTLYYTHNGIVRYSNLLNFRISNKITGSVAYSTNTNDLGFHTFTVPNIAGNKCEYDLQFEIIASTNNLVTSTSIDVYVCQADQPDIRVLTPSFFPLNIGTKHIVQYYSYKVRSVDIYLKENDEALTTITKLANFTDPTGYFVFDLPANLITGRNYLISVEDALVNGGTNSSFHFTAVSKKCEYSITDTFGNVTLPSYSQGFNWDQCTWKISNPCNSKIRFFLQSENIQGCETINVYDGESTNATLLASYNGFSALPVTPIETTGKNMFVRFSSCSYLTAPTSSVFDSQFFGVFSSVACEQQVTGVLRPTRLSSVVVGVPYKIRWLSQSGVDLVKVELYQNNALQSLISTNVTQSEFTWTPTNAGQNYHVRVSKLSDNTFVDSAKFEVKGSTFDSKIFVNGPTTVRQGASFNLAWTSNLTTIVNIDLYRGSEFIQKLASELTSNQTTIVFPYVLPSEYYRLVVSDAFTGLYTETDVFSITPNTPSIEVSSDFGYYTQAVLHNPQWNGIQGTLKYTNNLIHGRTYLISWTPPAGFSETDRVTIRIISEFITITTFTASGNKFWWTVPAITTANHGKHDKYQVHISAINNEVIYGVSLPFIVSPSTTQSMCPVTIGDQIKLTMTPQTFEAGKVVPITWTSIGQIPYVTITVESQGATIATLGGGCVPNTELYNWLVPNNLNGAYTVRISGVNTTLPSTTDSFNRVNLKGVATTITFTSPQAGDKWLANRTQTITWDNNAATSLAIPSEVRIFANGILISNQTATQETVPNTGSYAWDITKYLPQLGNAAYVNNFTLTITGSVTYQGQLFNVNGRSGVFFIDGVKLNSASGLSGLLSLTIICSIIALFFS